MIIQNINIIFDEQQDYQFKTIFTYIYGVTEPSKENMTTIVEQIKSIDSKSKAKNALELLLMEGEEIGIKKGIKKGEEIGIKKGRLLQSLINLLNLYEALPNLSMEKLADITKQNPDYLHLLKRGLELKDKEFTWKIINKFFLKDIQLTRLSLIHISEPTRPY